MQMWIKLNSKVKDNQNDYDYEDEDKCFHK